MKPKILEKDIQKAILQYLKAKKIFHYRQNSGAFQTVGGGYMRTSSVNGLPDIVAIQEGIYIGLEVKTQNGRQSDAQKDIQREITKAGGFYFIVRNIEDVRAIFESKVAILESEKSIKKWSVEELKEIIKTYKQKIKDLE